MSCPALGTASIAVPLYVVGDESKNELLICGSPPHSFNPPPFPFPQFAAHETFSSSISLGVFPVFRMSIVCVCCFAREKLIDCVYTLNVLFVP